MKILIYTTHRTGSTSLAQLLMSHYNCDYQREGFYKNKNFFKIINSTENIVIKLTPIEAEYDSVKDIFDKRIILIREDIQSQAESRIFAEKTSRFFSSYKIPESFLVENESLIEWQKEVIIKENEVLKSLTNCLHITYEDLYYNDGLKKIEEYLNTTMILKLDNSKKYRNGKKNII